MEVTPSKRKPSNLYSSTHQRELDSRKRKVSHVPAHSQIIIGNDNNYDAESPMCLHRTKNNINN